MVQISQEGGMVSLKKRGLRRLTRYPSLISILELAICLAGKAHVSEMKLNLNIFSLRLQIPLTSYCLFYFLFIYFRQVIYFILFRQVILFSRSP